MASRRRRGTVAFLLGALGLVGSDLRADGPDAHGWVTETASPVEIDEGALSDLELAALHRCGASEAGLVTTARWVLERKRESGEMPQAEAIAFRQRVAGEPHPWVRAWVASAPSLGGEAAMSRLEAWLGPAHDSLRLRRCGVASGVGPSGVRLLVVTEADALADLTPVPVRVRTGEWVRIEARLNVPATAAKVIVLGPSGWPQPLPTSLTAPWIRARFAPDGPGEFSFEVMADTAEGTRPVLEGSLFADVAPPAALSEAPAAGEQAIPSLPSGAGHPAESPAEALARMTSAARARAGLAALGRDARLDGIARDHAARMATAQQLGHDVGEGDPFERMRGAGLEPRDAGENVAHAASVALAHRAMWRSPAHRANTLRREFDRFGVGVVRDVHGDIWAAVEFAGGL